MQTDPTFYIILLVTLFVTYRLLTRKARRRHASLTRLAPMQSGNYAEAAQQPRPQKSCQPRQGASKPRRVKSPALASQPAPVAIPDGPVTISAAQFQQMLKLAGGDTRKITPGMLDKVLAA